MPATSAPKVTAADLAAAATRLAGTVVLDVAGMVVGPARWEARAALFLTLDGEELGEDDGTLIPLIAPGAARDLIEEHGTPGRAAAAINRALAAEFRTA